MRLEGLMMEYDGNGGFGEVCVSVRRWMWVGEVWV